MAGREQAPGQQDFAGKAVADDPEDLVADVGLQAVDAEDDLARAGEDPAEPAVVGEGRGEEFVVAVEEVGDGPLGHGHVAIDEVVSDLGYGAVLRIAESPDQGDDVEPELVVREREASFGLGPVGPLAGGAAGGVAAPDGEAEAGDAAEGVERAPVGVVGPEVAAAVGAGGAAGRQIVSGRGRGGFGRLGHGFALLVSPERTRSMGCQSSQVCRPRKKVGRQRRAGRAGPGPQPRRVHDQGPRRGQRPRPAGRTDGHAGPGVGHRPGRRPAGRSRARGGGRRPRL